MIRRVLIAFDKFKHSIGAAEACEEAAQVLRKERPDWTIETAPLSDGGEGFASILTDAAGGEWREATVTGPRGRPVRAGYGLVSPQNLTPSALQRLDLPDLGNGQLAVIEMAAASGLDLLAPEERDPWQTTSVGTGELLRLASREPKVAGILLGVGGSATQDLGLGALHALGLRGVFAPEFSQTRDPGHPHSLIPEVWPKLANLTGPMSADFPPVRIACDVDNPLLGPRGTVAVYAPQKGLRPGDRLALEKATAHASTLLCQAFGQSGVAPDFPGGGAAGGIAYGLKTALGARLVAGFPLWQDWLGFREKMGRADLVLTGEGCFDDSSLAGKGPGSLAEAALESGKTVWILAGKIGLPSGHPLWTNPRALLQTIAPPGTDEQDSHRKANLFLSQRIRQLVVKTQ